jgi:hypothetical protein
MKPADDATKKKPKYQRPEIKVHGSLRQLTQVKGGIRNDGGGKPKTKV